MLLPILGLLACTSDACPEGQIRDQGRVGDCVDYTAGEPQLADDAWAPSPGTSWQWVLSQVPDPAAVPDVDMLDLDLLDSDAATVAAVQARDMVAVCYFSAGSWEDWRSDAADYPDDALGKNLDGWDGERWVDIMDPTTRSLLEARLDRAVEHGCDGVEPDNVDGYSNNSGLPLNATEQLDFNRWLADAAHQRGLSVGLKNDLDQLEALEPWFDWALNEECAAYGECERLQVFTGVGKAVFHVEYVDDWADAEDLAQEVCGQAPWLDSIIKTWDLGTEYLACE